MSVPSSPLELDLLCTNHERSDLSAAVDVYSDWIDACDAVAKEAAGVSRDTAPFANRGFAIGNEERGSAGLQTDPSLAMAAEDDEDEDGNADYDDE